MRGLKPKDYYIIMYIISKCGTDLNDNVAAYAKDAEVNYTILDSRFFVDANCKKVSDQCNHYAPDESHPQIIADWF